MKLTINGEEREIEEATCLSDLLERLKLSATRMAVERNGGIVHRSEYRATLLFDGDRLEIVHFVGGG